MVFKPNYKIYDKYAIVDMVGFLSCACKFDNEISKINSIPTDESICI